MPAPTVEAAGAIRRVCVIGAGVMGAGIAAQIANSGTPVLLLDIPPRPGPDGAVADRNAIAAGAVARMRKATPAPFMSAAAARLVETGNTEDDLGRIAECDWVVEAIIERLDLKQALYRRIDAARRPGTAVSSNTSTIPLRDLVAGLGEGFARDFLITHFFNPPRHMRLLELVASEATDPALVARVAEFVDRRLGKSVVRCKDSPGFIANRLGTYWLQLGVNNAIAQGIPIEDADAINGAPFGIPGTGVFGLIDLVGLDLMPHINASLLASVGPGDWMRDAAIDQPVVARMIETGHTGRKGKGGFYRVTRGKDGARTRETMDLATGQYRPERRSALPELAGKVDLRALLSADTPAGRYAWSVFGRTLAYAATIIPEAADGIVEIDAAMRLGYNWRQGPFELIDRLGAAWFAERLRADGIAVPPIVATAAAGTPFYSIADGRRAALGLDGRVRPIPVPEGVLLLDDVRRAGPPVARNGSAALWDLGDGVACLEVTAKAAALDEGVMEMIGRAIGIIAPGDRFRALVIAHEGKNFSVGANIGVMLFAANIAAWEQVEAMIRTGQQALTALKRAPFPVVSAAFGMALGGGCEILLHSDAIQAHAETYAGLVEGGVGLVPGWGGCKEMLLRWSARPGGLRGPMVAPAEAFRLIGTATVSGSAAEARENGILRETDGITMNRDRLIADAKARALAMVEGYAPPAPAELRLPGPSGRLALELAVEGMLAQRTASPHDAAIGRELARILSGGDTDPTVPMTEEAVLELERESFLRLARQGPTLERLEHMLSTGKPLRN